MEWLEPKISKDNRFVYNYTEMEIYTLKAT